MNMEEQEEEEEETGLGERKEEGQPLEQTDK